MSLKEMIPTFPWAEYSKKALERLFHPYSAGSFSDERELFLAKGLEGSAEEGNLIELYWLVDDEGSVVDAKFQAFGQSALLAAGDAACQLVIGKSYDQARRVSAELIDKQLRDHPDHPAFPPSVASHLNLVIDAIEKAALACEHIALPEGHTSPVPQGAAQGEGYPGWETLSQAKKLSVIEEVIQEEIRPYIELDEGGIEVVKLEGDQLTISYQGACTSCFSAIGTTLSTISQILQAKVCPSLEVVPQMEDFTFST